MGKVIGFLVAIALGVVLLFQTNSLPGQTPIEVGQVNWSRDLEAAKATSKKTGKPLFVQFQEVPG